MADNPPATSLFGSIYNLGGSIASYATGSLNAFMGWEELDVVDPDGEAAQKGAKKVDEGLNGNVSVMLTESFLNGRLFKPSGPHLACTS